MDAAAGQWTGTRVRQGDGSFTVRDVLAGTYDVTARADEGKGEVDSVRVEEGEHVEGVQVEIARLGTVRGRLVGLDDGAPIPNRVVIAAKGGNWSVAMRTAWANGGAHISDREGAFVVEKVDPGVTQIFAFAAADTDPYADLDTVVDVQPGGVTDVGALPIARRALPWAEKGGDLGFTVAQGDPTLKPHEQPLTVALVHPKGPAADTGLTAGDVIIALRRSPWGEHSLVGGVRDQQQHDRADCRRGLAITRGQVRCACEYKVEEESCIGPLPERMRLATPNCDKTEYFHCSKRVEEIGRIAQA